MDAFGAKDKLTTNGGTYDIFRLDKLGQYGDIESLPAMVGTLSRP